MGKVTYVAFRGKSWTSKIIRFITRSEKYSHIAFLTKRQRLIECWPTKHNPFQCWDYSKFSNHKPGTEYEVWALETPYNSSAHIEDFFHKIAKDQVRYDWMGCLAFVFKRLSDTPHRLFCSEGCITPLVWSLRWSNIDPGHVSPQDFIEIIQAAGAKVIKRGVT